MTIYSTISTKRRRHRSTPILTLPLLFPKEIVFDLYKFNLSEHIFLEKNVTIFFGGTI